MSSTRFSISYPGLFYIESLWEIGVEVGAFLDETYVLRC